MSFFPSNPPAPRYTQSAQANATSRIPADVLTQDDVRLEQIHGINLTPAPAIRTVIKTRSNSIRLHVQSSNDGPSAIIEVHQSAWITLSSISRLAL